MFDTAGQAIGDLLRYFDAGMGEHGVHCAAALRADGVPRQLVVYDSNRSAYLVYKVPQDVHMTDAGDMFFDGWKSATYSRRFELLTFTGVPTIW